VSLQLIHLGPYPVGQSPPDIFGCVCITLPSPLSTEIVDHPTGLLHERDDALIELNLALARARAGHGELELVTGGRGLARHR